MVDLLKFLYHSHVIPAYLVYPGSIISLPRPGRRPGRAKVTGVQDFNMPSGQHMVKLQLGSRRYLMVPASAPIHVVHLV